MASLTLITVCFLVNVLAILAQSCKCEIPGLPTYTLEQQSILADYRQPQYGGEQGAVIYVPVCSPCQQSPHHRPHNCQGDFQNYQQQLGLGNVQQQHQFVVNSATRQRESQHQQTVHHHTGVSHQVIQQQVHDSSQDQDHGSESESLHKNNDNINYQFEYSVNDHKSGDVKRHREARRGDVVTGEYSLLEADGNVRTVKYYADWKTGFHAQVHNSKPKPIG